MFSLPWTRPARAEFASSRNHRGRKIPRTCRLRLEALEKREMLAAAADPDDRMVVANPTSVGAVVSGVLDTNTDVDLFAFTVQNGQAVTFDIDRPWGSALDAYLRLFDSKAKELAANDNGPAPGELAGVDAYLSYVFARGGTYYLGVSGHGNTSYKADTGKSDHSGSTGTYTLTLTEITPQTQLTSVAWSGNGQVKMKKQGTDSWQNDYFLDRGDQTIANGPKSPVWLDANGDGDVTDAGDVKEPVAFVRNAKPALRATLATTPGPRSVWLRATSIDAAALLVFTGAGSVAGSSLTVDLTTSQTVGAGILNRDVDLLWETSSDGVTYTPIGDSVQRLFVLYAAPQDTSHNSPTAQRINYATRLASGQTTVMDIAQMVADTTQSKFYYYFFYEGETAWRAAVTGGDCGSCAWLQTNALKVLGIAAQVRFVYACHDSWKGLWSTKAEQRSLGFVTPGNFGWNWNNYEGCCYVSDGATARWYLGGAAGTYKPTAYDVLMSVTADNSATGAHQCYSDQPGVPVSYPSAPPPA